MDLELLIAQWSVTVPPGLFRNIELPTCGQKRDPAPPDPHAAVDRLSGCPSVKRRRPDRPTGPWESCVLAHFSVMAEHQPVRHASLPI